MKVGLARATRVCAPILVAPDLPLSLLLSIPSFSLTLNFLRPYVIMANINCGVWGPSSQQGSGVNYLQASTSSLATSTLA